MKTMVNDQFRRNKLAKQMWGIVDGTIKLRPEKPGGEIVVKPGWTEWSTKGMGRGKAPRKKPQKQKNLDSEEGNEVEVNSETGSFSGCEPTPDLEPEPGADSSNTQSTAGNSNTQSQSRGQKKRRRWYKAEQTADSSSKACKAAGNSSSIQEVPIDPLLL
jgi:hypothetical protein